MSPRGQDPCVPRLTPRCFREQPERAKRLLALRLHSLFARATRSVRLPGIAPLFLTVASAIPPPAPTPEPPPTEKWTEKSTPDWSARYGAIALNPGNSLVYFGTGRTTVREKDWWEYDPATDTWTQKTDFGVERRYAVAAASGGKIYVGSGRNDAGFIKDWWEYDP